MWNSLTNTESEKRKKNIGPEIWGKKMFPCISTFTGRSELKVLIFSGMEGIYENLSYLLEHLICFCCFSDLTFNQDA